MNYWLMKSEPEAYSIADLQRDRTTLWDGVRNYQARNYMRQMQLGDSIFFYHSNATPPGIVGLMRVIEVGVVDPTQFDASSKYYDPKSKPEAPRWDTVKVEFVEQFPQILSLDVLRQQFSPEELIVIRQGNRLSVTPVAMLSAKKIVELAMR